MLAPTFGILVNIMFTFSQLEIIFDPVIIFKMFTFLASCNLLLYYLLKTEQ